MSFYKTAGQQDNPKSRIYLRKHCFSNPTNSLTLNGGTAQDDISIEGLDAAFDANLTINTNAGDNVTFQTNATNITSGDLNLSSEHSLSVPILPLQEPSPPLPPITLLSTTVLQCKLPTATFPSPGYLPYNRP